MARPRTHYEVLGLARDAASVDIAGAFREVFGRLKADSGTPPESMAAVREAYQVLASPEARAQYDSTLPEFPRRGPHRPSAAQGATAAIGIRRALPWMVPTSVIVVVLAFAAWKGRSTPMEAAVTPVEKTVAAPQSADEQFLAPVPMAAQVVAAPPPVPFAAPEVLSAEAIFAALSASIARVQVFDAAGKLKGQGSGVVISAGTVITNCHVVFKAAEVSVKVGGRVHGAKVLVADEEFDLCSLGVPGMTAASVPVGGAADVRVGQRVYAIGAPHGLELTLSEGIVSSLREVPGGSLIQTTAPISPGSSGGGLFNAKGQLVGIVTFQYRQGQNLNFAVPAAWLLEMRNRQSTAYVAEPVARRAAGPQ